MSSTYSGAVGLEQRSRADSRSIASAEKVTRGIVITDVLMIIIALGVATIAAWGAGGRPAFPLDQTRGVLGVAILVTWSVTLWQQQSRATSILGAGGEEYRRVLIASFYMLLVVGTFAYFSDTTMARSFVAGTFICGTVFLELGRWINRRSLLRAMAAGQPLHKVFVVAPPSKSGLVAEELAKSANRFVKVGQLTSLDGDPSPRQVVNNALAVGAETIVYIPFTDVDPRWTRELGWAMENSGLSLMVSPAVMEIAGPRLRVEDIQGLAFLSVSLPKFSGPARVVKRTMDLIGSILALVVLAIPMAVIAVAIKLDSRGPVLFSQPRMGRDGEVFKCHKFRTMCVDADRQLDGLRAASGQDGATFKLEKDPRVTRVGEFLRKTSLDELPQFWNVLVNEMSLVGPRPHQLADVERYDRTANRRLLAKPGITGLWQVSGRSDTSWDENVRLDLYYVENWSLSMDIVILLRTVKVVLTGDGAY